MSADGRPPLAESPWFWALVFALFALAMVIVFDHKYRGRQAQLERQFQSKERREAVEPGQPVVPIEPYSSPGSLIIPLWPLVALLVGVAVVSTVILVRRQRSTAPPPAERQPP